MSFQKVLPLGSQGQLELSESAGKLVAKLSLSNSAGGGQVQGFAKASLSAEVEVDAKELVDAALELAKVKFPGAASLIDMAKSGIDAEIAKV